MGRKNGSLNVFGDLGTVRTVLDPHELELELSMTLPEGKTVSEMTPNGQSDFGGNSLLDDLTFDGKDVLLNQQFPIFFFQDFQPVFDREELPLFLHLLEVH